MPEPAPDRPNPEAETRNAYWRGTIRLTLSLLAVWALVSLGFGVLLADVLNDLGSIGGVPLGFWFAQQGSIITFVFLILIYAVVMNRRDRKVQDAMRDTAPAEPSARSASTSTPSQDASSSEASRGGEA